MKVLGIDCGTKYVGVALGIDDIVTPLSVRDNQKELPYEILRLVESEKPDLIVIGVPVSNDNNIPKYILKFREELENVLEQGYNIEFVDERFTTDDALEKSIKGGVSKSQRKVDHSIAACEIIHRYFDQKNNPIII